MLDFWGIPLDIGLRSAQATKANVSHGRILLGADIVQMKRMDELNATVYQNHSPQWKTPLEPDMTARRCGRTDLN